MKKTLTGVAIAIAAATLLAQQRNTLPPLFTQRQLVADEKSTGCISCHIGIEPMHASRAVKLACTDCHGGDGITRVKEQAHVRSRFPEIWQRGGKPSTANPERSYTKTLSESPEFIRFINPGDNRVAQEACGSCYQKQVNAVPRSTMTTSSV